MIKCVENVVFIVGVFSAGVNTAYCGDACLPVWAGSRHIF